MLKVGATDKLNGSHACVTFVDDGNRLTPDQIADMLKDLEVNRRRDQLSLLAVQARNEIKDMGLQMIKEAEDHLPDHAEVIKDQVEAILLSLEDSPQASDEEILEKKAELDLMLSEFSLKINIS